MCAGVESKLLKEIANPLIDIEHVGIAACEAAVSEWLASLTNEEIAKLASLLLLRSPLGPMNQVIRQVVAGELQSRLK